MSDSVGKCFCSNLAIFLSPIKIRLTSSLPDRVFVHALNTVKRIPRTGSARPPPADRLKLYGLYKQSTEGNVQGISRRPESNDPDSVAEQQKWYDTFATVDIRLGRC